MYVQRHGALFYIFVFWLLVLPFSRYDVGPYSIDNYLAPLLCLAAIFLPRMRDRSVSVARIKIIFLVIGLYAIYRLSWIISYINEPDLFWKYAWHSLRSGFYFTVPLLYIRDLRNFRTAKSALVIVTMVAAVSVFMAAVGIVQLEVERFDTSRLGDAWIPKSIGLFSSYGDVAMLYGFTAVILMSHGKGELWLGLGTRFGKLVVWGVLLLGLAGSQSRNMLLTTVIAVSVYWLHRIMQSGKGNKQLMVGGIVAASSLVGVGMLVVFANDIAEAISSLGGAEAYQTAETRLISFTHGLALILKEPVIGVSLDTYRQWGALVDGIHNMWLNILLKGGLFGFAAMVGLLWIAYRNGKPFASGPVYTSEPALIVSSVAAILTATQFYPGQGDVLWVMLSILISFSWVRREKDVVDC